MAYQKKESTSNEVFVLTLPLQCELWQKDELNKLFRCCNQLKNALTAKMLKVLAQLERRKVWRDLQAELASVYQDIDAATDKQTKILLLKRQRALFQQRRTLLQNSGFTKFAFQKLAKGIQYHYGGLIHSQIVQKLSDSVWTSFERYLYGNGKAVHFSKECEFYTISGKSNITGLRYQSGQFIYRSLKIPVKLNRSDRYGYEREALSRSIHFCSLTRKWYPDGWHYFVQLVLSGKPPVKINPDTGKSKHPLGVGRVGNDIGPQTLATVADGTVQLVVLADKVQDIENALRRINRAMDRSRRATNPQMFDAQGRIVPSNKLPSDCVRVFRGKCYRKRKISKRYQMLAARRRYLLRKQADIRREQHSRLANQLLALGNEHYIEEMRFRSLARRKKETTISERTGKFQSKKRFGKSIANRAPALFVNIYEQKVKAAGGQFFRIQTAKAKASQYNHVSKEYLKKSLSQRWTVMPDGSKVQRDLYSAFLIQNTNALMDGFIQEQLDKKYANFKVLHDAEITRLTGQSLPSSTGIRG